MKRALLLLLLVGCKRSPAPTKAVPSAEVTPLALDAGSVATLHHPCKFASDATIDDGESKVTADGFMELQDVRILADDSISALTWTRTTNYQVGDSARVPHGALRSGTGAFTQVAIPVMSSACATFGSASPNTSALPLVVWGAMNNRAFEQFAALPKVAEDPYGLATPYSAPARRQPTPKQSVDDFVASNDFAVARVTELDCNDSCECMEGKHDDALWLWSLDPKRPLSTRIAAGKMDAIAFQLTEKGGIAAWRQKAKPPGETKLFFLHLDAEGKPAGKAKSFASGDVGAPAVAMSGADRIVVWAARAEPKSPYQLQWMKIGRPPQEIATTASAFAPAIIADDTRMVLAWMESDGGNERGEIHVARTTLAAATFPPSDVVSGTETNARDPELSGSVDRPAIVWSTFTKENAAGLVRAGRLDCGK